MMEERGREENKEWRRKEGMKETNKGIEVITIRED